MKKAICILLSLCMLLGSLVLSAGAAEPEMKVLVTSDVHWQNVGSVNPTGFFRPRASLGQMTSLTPLIVAQFLRDAAASDADYVFISGDLTDFGSPADARAFARILADFEDETRKQVFVIDGNHDIFMRDNPGVNDTDPALFKEIFARFGYDEALAVDEKTASYTADLKNGYRLLAIDSNRWEGHGNGVISDALLAWIETQVAAAQRDGKKLIAMMHHHLMEHFTMEQRIDDFYILENHEEICKKFDEWNIRVTFTGHLHVGDVAEYKGKNTIYDVTTAALSCYPLTYRAVTFTDSKIVMTSRAIDSLDVTDIVPGYSDDQIAMIRDNPAAYGYGCLQDSLIEDYVKEYVNADSLIATLGVEADSVIAKALKKFLPDVLIPIYGEGNTVEAKAKALGYSLTETDYETVGDLITAFFAGFVRGDENYGANNPEGRLFLESAYALFASQAGAESKAVQTLLSSKIIARLGLKGIDNVFTRAALDRLLVGFFVDKAPADNDLTLPGYTANQGTGFLARLRNFFRRFLDFFRGFFGTLA